MKLRVATSLLLLPVLMGSTCSKVPLHDVEAQFLVADASWFEEEQTLFLFWRVEAQQGLGDPSVVEITYATDTERVDWTPVEDLPTVHSHLPVDCGSNALCGSTSLHVSLEPREVDIRLRYHREGELALQADAIFNVVGPGPPSRSRSLIVYGVFDETNQQIQWRGRHVFPTLRNQEATDLGLRRWFSVQDFRYGTAELATSSNRYGYGADCPEDFVPTELGPVETDQRAVFHPDTLPIEASPRSVVCAESTVTDALGPFTTTALAQKNPEVRTAFPLLRSPVYEAAPVKFMLEPCDRTISTEHEQMQRQRLQLEGVPVYCTDDWRDEDWSNTLAVALTEAVEEQRVEGEDMVLVIGLHRDESGLAEAVEQALLQVVPAERHRSSPRLAGAFVFDSDTRGLEEAELGQTTLWCPASTDTSDMPDASSRTCATIADMPDIDLGPFSFGMLQILPNRKQYLDFLDDYGVSQAGEVTSLHYLTPEFAATSEHVDLGDFGVVTFLNQESISADADDAFSYCVQEELSPVVLSSDLLSDPEIIQALLQYCAMGKLPEEMCAYLAMGMVPLSSLPEWHNLALESRYDLGLYWDFPFLVRMEYRAVLAGSATAFGLSVPFGFGSPAEGYYGSYYWLADEFSLDPMLSQCRRFCDHPTFDSAGAYHVNQSFREAYAADCYVPLFPQPGDGGWPIDP